jgi:hypothetical protein
VPRLHVVGPAPTITSIDTATGPTQGGTQVTVTGTNFGVGSKATVGGVAAQGGYVGGTGGTKFALTTPSHAVGVAAIVITNTNDAAHPATSPTPFVYATGAAPTVTQSIPDVGGAGNAITILGTNFSPNMKVTIGGNAVPQDANNELFIDTNTFLVLTPAHADGAVDIVATNADGLSGTLTKGYTYDSTGTINPTPGVTGLGTTEGPTAGGTYVTIYAYSLTGTTAPTVTFGGTAATVKTVANGEDGQFLGVVTPPHAAGAVSVVVKDQDNQTATSPQMFTYVAAADGGLLDSGIDAALPDSGLGDGSIGGDDGSVSDSGSNDSGGGQDSSVNDSGSTPDSGPTTGDDSGPTTGNDSGPTTGNDSGPTTGNDSGPVVTPPETDAAAEGGTGDNGGGGGGCGCTVPGGEQRGSTPLSLLALSAFAVVVGRRRARRR